MNNGTQGQQGNAWPHLISHALLPQLQRLAPLALVLSLVACGPGSGGSSGPGSPAPELELSAWVGENSSELTLSGNIRNRVTEFYTYSDPSCAASLSGACSEQYQLDQSPFVVPSDSSLTLSQPAFIQLRRGNAQAETLLNARRFSGRYGHQAVYFNDQFWLVGGSTERQGESTDDDLWSSSDGRNWVQHTSVNSDNANKTKLFSNLIYHQLVVFDAAEAEGQTDQGEQLWVIGGSNESGVNNNVWSSSDGIHWTLHNEGERFTPRRSHQVAIFDADRDGQAELWLLGGFGGGRLGDIWTSTDGVNWTQQPNLQNTNGAAGVFPARDSHQLVAFDAGDGQGTQLWLIGGLDEDYDVLNDIWSSPDGIRWTDHGTAVDAEKPSAEAFSPHAEHSVIVFDAEGDSSGQQLWLIGGNIGDEAVNDVWSSSDGVHWSAHDPTPASPHFSPRRLHDLVVADADRDGHSELWLLGGISDDAYVLNDTWSSRNGQDWVQQTPYADFSTRTDHQVVLFDAGDGKGEQFWMVGGRDGAYAVSNEVWSSPDGVHWTQQPAVNSAAGKALFAPRAGHQLVVFAAAGQPTQLWLIGGQEDSSASSDIIRSNDVWSSPDGIHWTEQTLNCPNDCFSARFDHQVVVFDPAEAEGEPDVQQQWLWLIGGDDGAVRNDVWSSPDGINWQQRSAVNGSGGDLFVPRREHQLVVFDAQGDEAGAQLWLVGGADRSLTSVFNDVWSSPDGLTWTQHSRDCGGDCFAARLDHQVVVFDPIESEGAPTIQQQQLWIIGGFGKGNNTRLNDIWSSPDGSHWTQVTEAAPFSPRGGHQLVSRSANPNNPNPALWLIGGYADNGLSNEVWRSSNGRDWQLSIKTPLGLP